MPRPTSAACPPDRRPLHRKRLGIFVAVIVCAAVVAACGAQGHHGNAAREEGGSTSRQSLDGLAAEATRLTASATSLTAHAVVIEDHDDGKPARTLTVDAALTTGPKAARRIHLTDTDGTDGMLLAVGQDLYARGNSAFWTRLTNEAITADLPAAVASGGYAKVPYEQLEIQDVWRLLDPARLLNTPAIVWRASRESDGSRCLTYSNPLGRVDFTFPATGDAYPKRLVHQDWPRRTTVDYAAFNAPVVIDPPAPTETTDLTHSAIWQKATRLVF